ncbi:MAG: ABC transporter substrate-binding protein, partial [Pseudorhizobium sp.]
MNIRALTAALAATIVLPVAVAKATDLEVTHWWTSGGEAAAVAELAKAFDATGNKWVDGAIAGGGSTARPIMVSRITGGDPMAATQFNHGRQAQELVESGLMRDLTEVAEKGNWKDAIKPASLLESCTLDGKIYCVPINIHSWQWLWLSNAAFETAGVAVPKDWNEFIAAAPKLKEAGIQPLALGGQAWQANGLFDTLVLSLGGKDVYQSVYVDKDADVAAGPEMAKIFEAAVQAREMAAGSNVQDWNQA